MSGKEIEPIVMVVTAFIFELSVTAAIKIDHPFWAFMALGLSLIALAVFEGIRLYNWVLSDAD